MFPIKDTVPRRTYPFVTLALIILNGMVFMLELSLHGEAQQEFLYLFGLVPARYTDPRWSLTSGMSLGAFWPFLTNIFLHGGWFHIILNMWILYLFGDNVEDRMGHCRFLAFYLLSGFAANLVHFAFNLSATVPVIGASGAISGVMAAYLRLFPRARIVTLFPILFIPYFLEIPAFLFMGIWFLMQVISGTAALFAPAAGAGIAWWAHVGGFVIGFFLVRPFCGRKRGCHSDELYHYVFR